MIHVIRGKVRTGHRRGKDLGFPTANINLHKHIPEGIYISQTKISGVICPSLTFIGAAKTFGDEKVFAETYILNFSQNIYNQLIFVHLLKKIRGNKKFKTAEVLIAQMKDDERIAREYFKM